ncbi:MAG: hypothetical protein IJE05_03200 [Clostridia bacterium]|nr:hypothetical protein [Clostridia bacterium]
MLKKNPILKFEIISTIFIIILGILLHFTFEWSNNNVLVGTFSPVNESVWEHLKLLFFPMLISTIILYFYARKTISNYLCAKVLGIILAISFTIIFFYTYTGIIGTNFAIIDIGSFFVAVILGQYVAYQKMQSNISCNNVIPIIILLVLYLSFLIFTFFPPHIGLFKDPITGMFGI